MPGIPNSAESPTVTAFMPRHKSNLNKIQFNIIINDAPITPCIQNLPKAEALLTVSRQITKRETAYTAQLKSCVDIT